MKDEDELEDYKWLKYSFIIIGLSIATISFIYNYRNNAKYILIENKTGFEKQIESYEAKRGTLYFDFDDKTKYKLTAIANNFEYDTPALGAIIVGGDWITKKAGTDTIIVTRQSWRGESKQYLFVMGKSLNEKMKKF